MDFLPFLISLHSVQMCLIIKKIHVSVLDVSYSWILRVRIIDVFSYDQNAEQVKLLKQHKGFEKFNVYLYFFSTTLVEQV